MELKKNIIKATTYFKEAADHNNEYSSMMYGLMLLSGTYVGRDLNGAQKYLRIPAEKYGLLHYFGKDSMKDISEAAKFIKESAENKSFKKFF